MSDLSTHNRRFRRARDAAFRRAFRKGSLTRRSLARMVEILLSKYDPESTSENALRGRPLPLETIEVMGRVAKKQGRITRSRATHQDPTTTRCPKCSCFAAKPMSAADARLVRRVIELARLDDAVAYAFVKTTVLVTAASRSSMCDCDLRAWTAAIAEYAGGPDAAWRAVGVAT
jgi:hypothetical protein